MTVSQTEKILASIDLGLAIYRTRLVNPFIEAVPIDFNYISHDDLKGQFKVFLLHGDEAITLDEGATRDYTLSVNNPGIAGVRNSLDINLKLTSGRTVPATGLPKQGEYVIVIKRETIGTSLKQAYRDGDIQGLAAQVDAMTRTLNNLLLTKRQALKIISTDQDEEGNYYLRKPGTDNYHVVVWQDGKFRLSPDPHTAVIENQDALKAIRGEIDALKAREGTVDRVIDDMGDLNRDVVGTTPIADMAVTRPKLSAALQALLTSLEDAVASNTRVSGANRNSILDIENEITGIQTALTILRAADDAFLTEAEIKALGFIDSVALATAISQFRTRTQITNEINAAVMGVTGGGGATPFKIELLRTSFNAGQMGHLPVGREAFSVTINVEGTDPNDDSVVIHIGDFDHTVSQTDITSGVHTYPLVQIPDSTELNKITAEIAATGGVRMSVSKGSVRSNTIRIPGLSASAANLPGKIEMIRTTFANVSSEGIPAEDSPFFVVLKVEGAGNQHNTNLNIAVSGSFSGVTVKNSTTPLVNGVNDIECTLNGTARARAIAERNSKGRVTLFARKSGLDSDSKYLYLPSVDGNFDMEIRGSSIVVPSVRDLPPAGTKFEVYFFLKNLLSNLAGNYTATLNGNPLTVTTQPNVRNDDHNTIVLSIPATSRSNIIQNFNGYLEVQLRKGTSDSNKFRIPLLSAVTETLRNREQTKTLSANDRGILTTTLQMIPGLSFMGLVSGRRYKVEIMAKIVTSQAANNTAGFEVELRHGANATVIPYQTAIHQVRGGDRNEVYLQFYAFGEFIADATNPILTFARYVNRAGNGYNIVSKLTEVNDTDVVSVFGDPPAS